MPYISTHKRSLHFFLSSQHNHKIMIPESRYTKVNQNGVIFQEICNYYTKRLPSSQTIVSTSRYMPWKQFEHINCRSLVLLDVSSLLIWGQARNSLTNSFVYEFTSFAVTGRLSWCFKLDFKKIDKLFALEEKVLSISFLPLPQISVENIFSLARSWTWCWIYAKSIAKDKFPDVNIQRTNWARKIEKSFVNIQNLPPNNPSVVQLN